MVVISSGPAAPVQLSPGLPALHPVHASGDSGGGDVNDKIDDEDYPAYSMGSAAEILGTTPGFLRSLDEAKLLTPQRSEGGAPPLLPLPTANCSKGS